MDIDVTEDLRTLATWLNESRNTPERDRYFTDGALWALARVSGETYADLNERLTAVRAQHLAPLMPPMRLGMPEPFATGGIVRNPPMVGGGYTPPPGVGIRRPRADLLGTDDTPPQMPSNVSDEERQMMRDVAVLAAKDQSQAEHPSSRVWADVPGASRFVVTREATEPTPIAPDEPTAPPDPWSQREMIERMGPVIGPASDEEMAALDAPADDDGEVARAVAAVQARTAAMKR